MSLPDFKKSNSESNLVSSVNLSNRIHFVLISNRFNSFWVTLVSSAAIKSTCFKVSINLNDASDKLPIGVAQTKKDPTFSLIEKTPHTSF